MEDVLVERTLCVLHNNHECLVFEEVLNILDDIWVVQHCEDFDLIERCLSLFLGHLLNGNLLDDEELMVGNPPTQVDRTAQRKHTSCMMYNLYLPGTIIISDNN